MRTLMSIVLGIAVIFLSGCSKEKQSSGTNEIINDDARVRIDSVLQAVVDAQQVAGVSALIFEKGKEVYFNAYGFADLEAKRKFDRNTIVRIYSMTKPVTGVAIMQLYEKGAFQLDDPVSKYAPEFGDMKVFSGFDAAGKLILKPVTRPITIRDLTRHTSGFARPDHEHLGKMVAEADLMNNQNTLAEMASRLAKLPLATDPGEEWSYGISVDVQAYLVERISGKPFNVYVRENILSPLGMTSTAYVPVDTTRFAALYQKGEDKTLARVGDVIGDDFNKKEWPLKPGGYGLTSTVDDYQRFAQMLVNKGKHGNATILQPATVALMATNHLADTVTERMWLPTKGQVGFGIDFAVRLREPHSADENRGTVGEFFWDGAASTLFWVDPVNDLTAVLFVQVFPFDNALHRSFREAVYGKATSK